METHKCSKEPELAVLTTNLTNMQKDVGEIKVMIKDWFEKFNEKLDALDKKYATKESVETINEKVNWHTKFLWTVWTTIVLWMGAFIWKLITDLIWK